MLPYPIYVFGFPVHTFGIFAATSLLLGYAIAYQQFKKDGLSTEILPHFLFAFMIPAFLGARLFYVLYHWHDYAGHSGAIIKVWEGGLVQFGGIISGAAAAFVYCRFKKIPFLKLADPMSIGLCFGLAFSRLGCFAAGCCYGTPTSLPWGITFHDPLSLARPHGMPLHPVQLYTFAIELCAGFALLGISKRRSFSGEVFLSYAFLLSCARFLTAPFRAESHPANLVLAFLIFVSSGICWAAFNHPKGGSMKIKTLVPLAVLAIVAVFFSACGIISTQKMTRGFKINSSDVAQIQKGTSTEKDVLKLFGPPTKVRDTADGRELYYEYAQSGGFRWNLIFSFGGGTKTQSLLVWLNKEGVVTDYAYKS